MAGRGHQITEINVDIIPGHKEAYMDKEGFVREIEGMQRSMYRVARSILSNEADYADAVQEALLRAWESREKLREERYFRTWLTRILINECKAVIRRGRRCVPVAETPEMPAPPKGAVREVYETLFSLKEKYRLPMTLFYCDGYSIKEIKDILRLPEGTVKSRLSRGREQFRKEYAQGGIGDEGFEH